VKFAGLALRHRSAIYLAVALFTLGGIWALFTLPAGIYPEVTYPRIVVIARGGTFEAEEMTVAATRPLEQALSGIIGLLRIRSKTVRGSTELSLYFRPEADMLFALSQVEAQIGVLRTSLPPGIELTAERLTPSVFPILQYELTGAPPIVLRDLADFAVRPRLAGFGRSACSSIRCAWWRTEWGSIKWLRRSRPPIRPRRQGGWSGITGSMPS
jgi:multidrug efflux pump subunit AcrB